MNVPYAVKRLSLAFALIAGASTVLLLSDTARAPQATRKSRRVALFQFAPHPLLDEYMDGVRAGLAEHGYRAPDSRIQRFTADADLSVANAIAKELSGGGWDMVVTATTPLLQAMARANNRGKVIHVFGLVTDPFVAGVGLDKRKPQKHPPHLIGNGSFNPVADTFQLARELNPSLKTVGTVWNSAEANSEAQIAVAREVCERLDLVLIEANADSSTAVLEAAASLLPKGVEAIWVPGDNVAMNAIGAIINVGRRGKVPVFASVSGTVRSGTLFDVGPDHHELGRINGELAGRILGGEVDPAGLPIQDVMPKQVLLNPSALEGLRGGWRIPEAVLAKADGIWEAGGLKSRAKKPGPRKTWRIRLIHFSDAPFSEDAQLGMLEGFQESGLVAERDYEITIRSAQGDVATLNGLFQSAESERIDLLMTTSTPTLQIAVQRIKKIPVVFNVVADPILAGAGKSYQDHLPNITGIATTGDYGRLVSMVRACLPGAKRVGTLFAPAEINMVFNNEQVRMECQKRGLELISLPVDTSSEVANAAQALVGKDIDAVLQIPGNLTASAFASISQAATRARMPLFSFVGKDARMGSVLTVSRDYEQAGRDGAEVVVRIMRGEDPAKIPFQLVSKSNLTVNLPVAAKLGISIPERIKAEAVEIIR